MLCNFLIYCTYWLKMDKDYPKRRRQRLFIRSLLEQGNLPPSLAFVRASRAGRGVVGLTARAGEASGFSDSVWSLLPREGSQLEASILQNWFRKWILPSSNFKWGQKLGKLEGQGRGPIWPAAAEALGHRSVFMSGLAMVSSSSSPVISLNLRGGRDLCLLLTEETPVPWQVSLARSSHFVFG